MRASRVHRLQRTKGRTVEAALSAALGAVSLQKNRGQKARDSAARSEPATVMALNDALGGTIPWFSAPNLRASECLWLLQRGCPQGRVISLLLWTLGLDKFLYKLDQLNIDAQGCANDPVITVVGYC